MSQLSTVSCFGNFAGNTTSTSGDTSDDLPASIIPPKVSKDHALVTEDVLVTKEAIVAEDTLAIIAQPPASSSKPDVYLEDL